MSSRLRIIVGGMAGMYPLGGVAWDYLQYAVGFARLGHDVFYHEDTWSWPYHPVEKRYTSDGTYSAQALSRFFQAYAPELQGRWHYRHLHAESFGMDRSSFDEVARTADLFLNVSGACILPEHLSPGCVKVFLDTDPGYNQIILSERFSWSENVDRWCATVRAHDRHMTYGENIHGADCLIPKLGLSWNATRMPVVRELWEPLARARLPASSPWTTVMTWNAFKGKLVYRGVEYQSKGSEFEKLASLPQRSAVPLRVAVGGVQAPLEWLARQGWDVQDGPSATLTPARYQEFIARSRGELSVAKHVYVAMRTGWFSCRSACYLAAARPVVVQDTGFVAALPVGEGILTFTNLEQAAAAITEVEGNYQRHARAAEEIARDHFDSDKVLGDLLDRAFARDE